jgi:hypothetical protein
MRVVVRMDPLISPGSAVFWFSPVGFRLDQAFSANPNLTCAEWDRLMVAMPTIVQQFIKELRALRMEQSLRPMLQDLTIVEHDSYAKVSVVALCATAAYTMFKEVLDRLHLLSGERLTMESDGQWNLRYSDPRTSLYQAPHDGGVTALHNWLVGLDRLQPGATG